MISAGSKHGISLRHSSMMWAMIEALDSPRACVFETCVEVRE